MSGGGGRKFRGSEVLLHVYDLAPVNAYTEAFGIGVFHSGVEFMGTEYTFGGHERDSSGIFTHSPRQAPNATFRTTINLGETDKSAQDVRAEIAALGEHFPGQSYSLITKNCNHFSVPGPPLDDCLRARAEADVDCKVADAESRVQNELALRLTGQPIPPWVNRLAYLGSWVGCLLPKDLGVAHPDAPAAQGSRAQYGRSSATAFKPFAGQGLSLVSQEMMTRSEPPDHDAGDGAEERRALLASAALARFSTSAHNE